MSEIISIVSILMLLRPLRSGGLTNQENSFRIVTRIQCCFQMSFFFFLNLYFPQRAGCLRCSKAVNTQGQLPCSCVLIKDTPAGVLVDQSKDGFCNHEAYQWWGGAIYSRFWMIVNFNLNRLNAIGHSKKAFHDIFHIPWKIPFYWNSTHCPLSHQAFYSYCNSFTTSFSYMLYHNLTIYSLNMTIHWSLLNADSCLKILGFLLCL